MSNPPEEDYIILPAAYKLMEIHIIDIPGCI